ncbi:MAG TPA: hypothetical protein VD859_09225 [Nocardioides sp.]|nr:hypothetical protein [Nocardioides sp.]
MDANPGAARRVALHLGVPKSGTTFLQRAIWRHRDDLVRQGVTPAGDQQQDMFHAAIEVREAHEFWGFERDRLDGTWRRLCAGARSYRGTTVMSHELLGAARDPQVERALADLDGLDVHLVVTARDLARQVTSEWQERVKNGNTVTFAGFRRSLEGQIRRGDFSSGFWRNQHLVGVLDRWAAGFPPENVHVVVAPPSGAAPDLLWRRFAEAVGFDGGAFDPTRTESAANQTLGTVQVALLRRVNEALDGRIKQPHYARVVKRQFAQKTLAAQRSDKPDCPPDLVERLRELAEEQNAEITARGYRVHGDLAELVPVRPTAGWTDPDAVDADAEAAAAAAAIAELLAEKAASGRRRRGARDEVEVGVGSGLVRRVGARVRRRLRG